MDTDSVRVECYRRVLGLGPGADLAELGRCYRREMRRWHPDAPGGDPERAKLLNEARDYLVLHPRRLTREPEARVQQPVMRSESSPTPVVPVGPAPVPREPADRVPVLGALVMLYVLVLLLACVGWLLSNLGAIARALGVG